MLNKINTKIAGTSSEVNEVGLFFVLNEDPSQPPTSKPEILQRFIEASGSDKFANNGDDIFLDKKDHAWYAALHGTSGPTVYSPVASTLSPWGLYNLFYAPRENKVSGGIRYTERVDSYPFSQNHFVH